MRKFQREITDRNELLSVLDACQTIRLGLYDNGYPYVIPLSFGYEQVNGKIIIYFHSAKEGKNASIIAFGHAETVSGDEAIHGIELLLNHCRITGYSARDCVKTDLVAVYKITVKEMTGKRRFPPQTNPEVRS